MPAPQKLPRGGCDAFTQHLRAIGRIPLLTPEEEITLARAVQRGRQLLEIGEELKIRAGGVEPSREAWAAEAKVTTAQLRQQLRRAERAQERMVTANLRLVVSVARKYAHFQLEMEDLIQEGTLGLIKAVDRFDPARGYRFSTYAYWWIRQAVSRHIQEHGALIRVPYPLANLAAKLEGLTASGQRRVSTADAAELLGEHPRRIEQALSLKRFNASVSLDQTIGSGDAGDMTLLDTVSDGQIPELEDDYTWFYGQLSQLSPLEFEVLNQRYAEEERRSLMQVAQQLGKSKHQIQAIERRALTKLRVALTPVLNP